jgi:iron complex outermembrane receptor protein
VQLNPQLSVITGGNADLTPETSESWVFGAVWSPSFLPRLSLEANYFDIQVDGAIQAIDAETLLGRCSENGDALSCAAITRTASGAVSQIRGLLQNIAGIETDGLDVTLNWRTGETGMGRFGLFWTNTFLFNYHVSVPATNGVTVIEREGTEQGSPDQAFPKWKSTAVLDWRQSGDGGLGASLTGRYIAGVDEANGNRMGSRLYTDLPLRPGQREDVNQRCLADGHVARSDHVRGHPCRLRLRRPAERRAGGWRTLTERLRTLLLRLVAVVLGTVLFGLYFLAVLFKE